MEKSVLGCREIETLKVHLQQKQHLSLNKYNVSPLQVNPMERLTLVSQSNRCFLFLL